MRDGDARIVEKFEVLRGVTDQKLRRLWAAATESRILRYGGMSVVARAC